MPLSSCFRSPFASQRVHESQTLLERALQHLHPNFPLIQEKLSSKTSLLIRSEILGLFGQTLTADLMYSRHICQKLWQKVQTLLSQKRGTFSRIFIAFMESPQNFAHFQKKDQLHSLNISKDINPHKCCYFISPKLLFQNTRHQ